MNVALDNLLQMSPNDSSNWLSEGTPSTLSLDKRSKMSPNDSSNWLSKESFDFDINSPNPTDDNSPDEEEEVFIGPLTHKERCIATIVREKEEESTAKFKIDDIKPEEQAMLLRESALLTLRIKDKMLTPKTGTPFSSSGSKLSNIYNKENQFHRNLNGTPASAEIFNPSNGYHQKSANSKSITTVNSAETPVSTVQMIVNANIETPLAVSTTINKKVDLITPVSVVKSRDKIELKRRSGLPTLQRRSIHPPNSTEKNEKKVVRRSLIPNGSKKAKGVTGCPKARLSLLPVKPVKQASASTLKVKGRKPVLPIPKKPK